MATKIYRDGFDWLIQCKPVNLLNKYERWRKVADILKLSRPAKQRLEWLIYYETAAQFNASLTCRHFGISDKTFYKLKKLFNPLNLRSTEKNLHLLKGQWEGFVKVFLIKSGVKENTASLDIWIYLKVRVVLILGGERSVIFENGVFKDGYFLIEKKDDEWIKLALFKGGDESSPELRVRVEFKIKNKNRNLPNITGEGDFIFYQK